MKIFVCNLSDTKENLDSLTAVLKKGLLIYEEDTKKVKITDGIHQYKDLGYIMQLDSSFVTDLNAIKTINGNIEYKTIYDANQQPITASTLKLQTFSTNSTNNTISIDTSNFVTRNDLNYRFDNFYYPIDIYQGATSTKSGIAGLVPEATSLQKDYVLQGNGHWSDINNLVSAISGLELSFNAETNILSIDQNYTNGNTNNINISLEYYANSINNVNTRINDLLSMLEGKLFTDEYREKLESIDLNLYVSKDELPSSVNDISPIFNCNINRVYLKLASTYTDGQVVDQTIDMSSILDVIDAKITNNSNNNLVILEYDNNIVNIDGNYSYYYINVTKNTEFIFPEIDNNVVKMFTLFIDNPDAYPMIFPSTVNNIRSAILTNIDEQTEYILKFTGINANNRSRWYVTI